MLVHIFTHEKGFIESMNLSDLEVEVARQGLAGSYTTRERIIIQPEPIPISVSTYQAKAALAIAGRYDEVEAFMKLETTDRITKLKWEYSNFIRDDPSVLAIAGALGLTDQELDELFALAASIE